MLLLECIMHLLHACRYTIIHSEVIMVLQLPLRYEYAVQRVPALRGFWYLKKPTLREI